MNTKPFFQAFGKFFFGLLLVGLLLFVPAGTINYPNAWLLIGILFVPISIKTILNLNRVFHSKSMSFFGGEGIKILSDIEKII